MGVVAPNNRVSIIRSRACSRQDIPCVCIVLIGPYTTLFVGSFENGALHFKLVKDTLRNHIKSMDKTVIMPNALSYMGMHCIVSGGSIPKENLDNVTYLGSQDRSHIPLPTKALLFLGIT